MRATRRQFIKLGAGAATVGVVLPGMWLREARARNPAGRRIFVVVQLNGGNDGLNTVIPYANARYRSLRPALHFKEGELRDARGRPTILTDDAGLHPALGAIKEMYDAGRVAVIRGVGYPNPNLSHFLSTDIWHTAELTGRAGEGWLGRYADIALARKGGVIGAAIGSLPRSLDAGGVVLPNITDLDGYTFQTDGRHRGDRENQLSTFRANHTRTFAGGSFAASIAGVGLRALEGAQQVQEAVRAYTSPITYPAAPNPLSGALRAAAQIITTIPGADLFYVQMGGFDHHARQIGSDASPRDKLAGEHARLLGYFSEAVRAFCEDMAAHGLADNVVLMQWSEFGRRPNENDSLGTDHGTASTMFVIGSPVRGGLYGEQPSLEAAALDKAWNMAFNVDFRAVYATILDRWLGVPSREVLGARFENVGFLG